MKPYSYKRINIGNGEDDSSMGMVENFTLPRSQPSQQPREVRTTQSKRAPIRESYKLQQTRENFMHNNMSNQPVNMQPQPHQLTSSFQNVQVDSQSTSQTAPQSAPQPTSPSVQCTQEFIKSELDTFMKGIKTMCDELKSNQDEIKLNVSKTKFRLNTLMILIIVWISFKFMMALLQVLINVGAIQIINKARLASSNTN
jgi:hypothetical protein